MLQISRCIHKVWARPLLFTSRFYCSQELQANKVMIRVSLFTEIASKQGHDQSESVHRDCKQTRSWSEWVCSQRLQANKVMISESVHRDCKQTRSWSEWVCSQRLQANKVMIRVSLFTEIASKQGHDQWVCSQRLQANKVIIRVSLFTEIASKQGHDQSNVVQIFPVCRCVKENEYTFKGNNSGMEIFTSSNWRLLSGSKSFP